MSTTSSSKRPEVDLETLALNIQLVREEIDALKDYLRRLLEAKESVERAIAGLKSINESEDSAIVFLDPAYNVAVAVAPLERGRALVSLGFNIYAKLPTDQAVKILEERRARLERAVDETAKTISQLASLHDRYYLLLQQLVAQAERKR
ncbi:MAG: hypothetical protein QXS85_01535 [Acidilobaceae archaeon]